VKEGGKEEEDLKEGED